MPCFPWLCFWLTQWRCLINRCLLWLGPSRAVSAVSLRRSCHRAFPIVSPVHARAKPSWVREELLALAARDPAMSCRRLADIFNRRHMSDSRTVGKSFVATLLKRHRADILQRRRELKRRTYQSGQPNRVWGVDGTGKTDEKGTLHFLLGIVDHGTRRCLTLDALRDKSAISIVRALCDAVERHGKPSAIRTDNEPIFQSRLCRTSLALLGIRHQTTEPHCPWQNGRIERFFGTLKAKLDRWAVADRVALNASLSVFRIWYNHVRPHQHLQGCTPIEAWNRCDIRRRPIRRTWFEAWDGLLQGEYLQRQDHPQ